MNRRNFLAIASLLTGAGGAVAAGGKDASCAALLEWNQALIAAVMAETPPPALTARNFALFHLALHEAAMDAVRLKLPVQPALAAAAAGVAASFYPGRSQVFEALLLRQAPGSSDAHRLGSAAASRWLDSRASDGASTTIHYVPHDEPGQWRRTPPALRPPELPHWGTVRPFLLSSGSQFRPPAPPPWDSADFWIAADEVRRLGSAASTSRMADQTLAARFWSDFSYTPGPPGHWNEIACRLLRDRRIGLIPATRLLARLNAALADAGIACWDAKYAHNSWRPITALRHGCAPRSVAPEPGWDSLLPSPPHPEFPSGHATFSGAAASVLADFFGGDSLRFSVASVSVPGVERGYSSLAACAQEIAASRVWAGIHFAFAGAAGLDLGRRVAAWSLGCPLPVPGAATAPSAAGGPEKK